MMTSVPTPLEPDVQLNSNSLVSPAAQLTPAEYSAVRDFLEGQAGIRLGEGKEYLVTSRLGRLVGELKLESFSALCEALKSPGGQQVKTAVVDAMTTNETFWFRDPSHYLALTRDVLGKQAPQRVRIWSAASSTGQEVYSIAISLQEAKRELALPANFQYEILGTDISPTALAQAKTARYCGVSASRGLTDEQRHRYFKVEGDCLEVLPQYRASLQWREFNLMKPFELLGRFDVIFCRNVLIYFSPERKRDIVERFARALNPGGILILGSTESMSDHGDLFEMQSSHGALIYRKR